MKHRIFLFLLLLSAITAHAQTFDYNGLEYSILSEEDKTCAVSEQSKTISGDVVIPSVVEYNNNDYLVVEIGSKAFVGQQLQSIALPSSLKSIGMYAFYKCDRIVDLVIPEKVDSIGTYAFVFCTSLVSVSIPESMKKIGPGAFGGCYNLKIANFESIESLCAIDFGCIPSPYFYDNTNPLSYTKKLFIGGKEITDLVIPETVKSIGKTAFMNCENIVSVTFPKSINEIGTAAFAGCKNIVWVDYPDFETLFKIDYYGSANPLKYASFLSINGKQVDEIVVPKTVTSIGNNVFDGYVGLKSIEIPDWVTSIGSSAFANTGLEEIVIPNSIKSIGAVAFSGCHINAITIPNSVRRIGEGAFCNCEDLRTVELLLEPGAIVEEEAFDGSNYIREFGITSIENLCKIGFKSPTSNPLYYSNKIYVDGKEIRELEIPNSVTSIGAYNFAGCKRITSLKIPDSIETIEDEAFNDAISLQKIIYQTDSPVSADASVFSDNTYLNATLFIPEKGLDAADRIDPWRLFKEIEVLEDSGIGDVVIDRNDGPVAVYNLQGLKVADSTACLPAGIYIVKQGAKTKKIIIQ
ncbi:MAG: leucine-rich repeat domain-containing protein [Duncaniella sp.]|nr:leucine-rich repeat domain-containing protein [Duncaniella sp.]